MTDVHDEPIVKMFGRRQGVRVLLVLVDAEGETVPAHEIADRADVAPKTVYRNGEMLVEYGMVEWVRQDGFRAKMDSEGIRAFTTLRDALAGDQQQVATGEP